MKTNLLKRVAVAGVFAVAVSGAFATHAQTLQKRTATTKPGFVRGATVFICNNEENCQVESNSHLCRVGGSDTGTQLWGKDDQNRCVQTLYRIMP
ncbi:hypothetical protein [Flavobacterium sp. MK4S-17]|uniref:hypothetical protein n=1 Tax=Flavobacterium sp. MK4S-17 TaxID=2543737 RepID=UPI00135A11C8|nr:hypothetical protein [Flavobacterium sp. MK4S-17]